MVVLNEENKKLDDDAKLHVQLVASLKMVAYKELIKDMKEIIVTPDFPRNTSKKFLLSWLNNLEKKL